MTLNDLDFASVSETKAKLSEILQRLHETKRTLAVTSHGKPAAVLLDFEEFRRLTRHVEELEASLAREKPGTYSTAADPITAVRGSGKGEGLLKALLEERRKDREREDKPRRG